jgi:hypothetical protein
MRFLISDCGCVGGSFKDHTCPMAVEQYTGNPQSQTGTEPIRGLPPTINDSFHLYE